MNGGDKLVRGVTDNGAMVESTVNILISDVVVTDEGNSGVVVTVTIGVISGSKLLSVIKSITLSVDWLVMDTTPGVVIKDGVINAVTVESIKVLDCITVSVIVSVRSTVAVTDVNISVVRVIVELLCTDDIILLEQLVTATVLDDVVTEYITNVVSTVTKEETQSVFDVL